jgi:hypothetical protein
MKITKIDFYILTLQKLFYEKIFIFIGCHFFVC